MTNSILVSYNINTDSCFDSDIHTLFPPRPLFSKGRQPLSISYPLSCQKSSIHDRFMYTIFDWNLFQHCFFIYDKGILMSITVVHVLSWNGPMYTNKYISWWKPWGYFSAWGQSDSTGVIATYLDDIFGSKRWNKTVPNSNEITGLTRNQTNLRRIKTVQSNYLIFVMGSSHPGVNRVVQQLNKSMFRGVWGHYALLFPQPLSPVIGFKEINRSVITDHIDQFSKMKKINWNCSCFCVISTK